MEHLESIEYVNAQHHPIRRPTRGATVQKNKNIERAQLHLAENRITVPEFLSLVGNQYEPILDFDADDEAFEEVRCLFSLLCARFPIAII